MTSNDDSFGPTRHQPGDCLADDWLSEHGATQDVSDSAIGAEPHLLELKLCNKHVFKGFILIVDRPLNSHVTCEAVRSTSILLSHLCIGL